MRSESFSAHCKQIWKIVLHIVLPAPLFADDVDCAAAPPRSLIEHPQNVFFDPDRRRPVCHESSLTVFTPAVRFRSRHRHSISVHTPSLTPASVELVLAFIAANVEHRTLNAARPGSGTRAACGATPRYRDVCALRQTQIWFREASHRLCPSQSESESKSGFRSPRSGQRGPRSRHHHCSFRTRPCVCDRPLVRVHTAQSRLAGALITCWCQSKCYMDT